MKIIRYLAAALAALAALLVLAVLLVVWFFDPNDYKDYVTQWAEEQTGRTFTIDGSLELEIFPWLAVETGGITVGNAEGFGEAPFAIVERVAARVRLIPLLSREFDIGTVTLEGVELNLAVDGDSRNNWEDLLRRLDVASTGSAAVTVPDRPAGPTAEPADEPLESLDIEGIRVRDGLVYWRENVDELRYLVRELTLDTGSIGLDRTTDIELGFEILDIESQLALGIESEATVTMLETLAARDMTFDFTLIDGLGDERARGRGSVELAEAGRDSPITLGTAQLSARLTDAPLGSGTLDVDATWQSAELVPEAQALRVEGLETNIAGVQARWQLSGNSIFDTPRLAGTVEVAPAPLAAALELLAVVLPDGVDADSLGRFEGRADFASSLESRQIELGNVNANLLGFTATGQASLDGTEQLSAELVIGAFDTSESLRTLLAAMLPATIDAAAFERLAYTGGLDWNRAAGSLTLRDFEAELLGAAATGELEIASEPEGTAVRGSVSTSRFAPDAFASAFAAPLPENIGANELGTLAVDAEFSYDPMSDSAIVDPVSLEVFGLRGNGRVTVTRLSQSAMLEGQARLGPFVPRELLRRFDQPVPQTTDPTALQSANVAARFEIDATGGQFDDIELRLDESRIEGNVVVNDFRNPAYRFTLAADRIDVDRYLPPRAAEADAGQRAAGDIRLSSRALDALDIDGRIEVGDLTLAGLSFQNVVTPIVLGEGRAELTPARADLYSGRFDGGLSVDTTGERPSLAVSGQAIGLQLAPLLAARAGESNVSGSGSFDLSLKGSGETVTENLRNAEGNLSFALRDGTLEGFNLGRSICAAFNAIDALPPPDDSVPDRTNYELIQGAATVSEGIAHSDELLVRTAFMDIAGAGRLGLAGGQLNYDFESELTGPIGIRGCEPMDDMIGGSIPWTLTGTLSDAEIRPDFEEYLRQRIEDEAADRLRERLEDELRDLL